MFRKNPRLRQQLQADPAYTARMMAAARTAATFANAFTPRIMPRNAQAVEAEPTREGARIVNRDYGGHIAEWGSRNSAPQAPLRRGVQAAGLRLEKSGPK